MVPDGRVALLSAVPIIFSATWKFNNNFLRGLIMAAAVILLWRCPLVFYAHASSDRTYLATDTRIDSILYGAILAVALKIERKTSARWCSGLWVVGARRPLLHLL
jgi:peptidoglycan/LPS O-acetylase OafA/YrhL